MSEPLSKPASFWQPWWGPVLVIVLVVIGYHKLLLGYNLFIHEDWIALSNHTFGNKLSNGWRPDKGLGISNFYGDPGMWHPWSLFSLWERLFSSRLAAHSSSVVIMDSLAALSVYFFSRRFIPGLNVWIAIVLSPVLIFCFGQPSEHYSRSFISLAAGMPLYVWLLFRYYQRPRWLHVLTAALLFWLVAFLGNLWSLTQLWMVGVVFTLGYRHYHKNGWGSQLKSFLFMHVLAVTAFLFLGAYIFYSFGLDQAVTGFVREKAVSFTPSLWPDYKTLVVYLSGFVPFEVIPIQNDLAAMFFLPYRMNVTPVFIFVCLFFLSRKAQGFWEFTLKVLLTVFFIHGALFFGKLLPGYNAIYGFLANKTSKLLAMYDFVYSLETILIILFIWTVNARNVIVENRWGRRLQIIIAVVTVSGYLGMLALSLFSQILPQQFLMLADNTIPSLLPAKIGGYSKELLTAMLFYNSRRFQELITPAMIAFYIVTIAVAGVFIKDAWLKWAAGLNKAVLAGVILLNSFLLSWALYPATNKPWVWEDPAVQELGFKPTDRFYFVRYFQWEKTPEGFDRKFNNVGGGHREPLVGYLETPGINISGFKSFSTKAEHRFMSKVFQEAELEYERLYYGSYFLLSPLLDMAAVKYYYSDGPIRDLPPQLAPFAQFKQLYIYENKKAWPYFYLADNLKEAEQIIDPQRGTAYLESSDMFQLPVGAGAGDIQLTSFGYGKFKFAFNSLQDEFLVVADAWHPFWKAEVNGRQVPVVKANEIFKGVRLPAGRYDVVFYFDTIPFKPGIYVSVIAWILFVICLAFALKDRGAIRFLEVKK